MKNKTRFTALLSASLMAFVVMGVSSFAKEDKTDKVSLEAAKQMMNVMGASSMGFDKIMTAMSKQLIQVLSQQYPGKQKQVGEIMSNVMKTVLVERAGEKEKMVQKNAAVYASHFSASELNDITAFYKTAVGQKLVAKLPVISMETMKVSQAWAQEFARDLMGKFDREAKKRGLKK